MGYDCKKNTKWSVKLSDGSSYKERASRSRRLSWELAWEHWSKLSGLRVLEIGPRYSRNALRRQLQLNGCEYYSITAGVGELKRKNVSLPPTDQKITQPGNFFTATDRLTDHFEEDFFDIIIGIESFEHWGDQIKSRIENYPGGRAAYKIGVQQCAKILKPGGRFEQEVPVQSHGEDYFRLELWDELQENFPSDTWSKMQIIEKGRELDPSAGVAKCEHIKGKDYPHFLVRCSDCSWNAMLKWHLI